MTCTSPITISDGVGGFRIVACQHCMACRINKTREWTVRLLHESSYWTDSVFLTLTYNDDHIPTDEFGRHPLVKKDFQKFMKRLRKNTGRDCIYYACGEYGDLTQRCHFHAIIFGFSPKDLGVLQKNWPFGFVKVGSVTPDSINYVTGYVRKKFNGKKKEEVYGDLPSPFQLQSHGFGLRYACDHSHEIADAGITVKGKPCTIPRYYIKKVCELRNKSEELQAIRVANEIDKKSSRTIFEELDLAKKIIDSRVQDALNNEVRNRIYKRDKKI